MWTAAQVADVILLTTPKEAVAVQDEVSAKGLSVEVRPIKIPLSDWEIPSGLRGLFRYCSWQWRAAAELRHIEKTDSIDVAHHVTFASDSMPTALLASRAPVRIWGPVGGAAPILPGIFRYLTPKGAAREIARWVGTGILRRTTGRLVARHATRVLVVNDEVRRRVERTASSVEICSSIAIIPAQIDQVKAHHHAASFNNDLRTAVFAGRLLDWKGLLLAVDTMQFASGWRLLVVGAGPHLSAAQQRAERSGVEDRVEFIGRISRSELFGLYTEADALLFPSFHDAEGWVVAEASAFGCPVVCLDVGGPKLWAGRNARVVPVRPAATLPMRLGARLQDLNGRGVPDVNLYANRLLPLVMGWYGHVGPSEEAGIGVN